MDRVPGLVASPWLDAEQAAAYVQQTTRSIYRACGTGELRHVRINGKREMRTRAEWLDEWLKKYEYGGTDRPAPAGPAHEVLTHVARRR